MFSVYPRWKNWNKISALYSKAGQAHVTVHKVVWTSVPGTCYWECSIKIDTSDAFLVGEITIGAGQSERAALCLPFPISSWETESSHHFSLPFTFYFRFCGTDWFTLMPRSNLSTTVLTTGAEVSQQLQTCQGSRHFRMSRNQSLWAAPFTSKGSGLK